MAVLAVTKSTQVTNITAVPSVRVSPLDLHGRLRHLFFDWLNGSVAGDAAGVITIVKLPAGRVRVLGKLSNIYHNMTTGSNTIDIGWKAHTDLNGDAVAASPDGLDNGISVETAGTINICTVQVATGSFKIFESESGVELTITSVGIIAAADVLQGSIAYVLD